MENVNNYFSNKNTIQFQRPRTTYNKSLQLSKKRGLSAPSKNFFPNVYNKKQKFQFSNTLNQKFNQNNFFSNNEYFWDKEKLFDKCMKLQNELNNLNQQYKYQKVENIIQTKFIKNQNNLLNKFKIPINFKLLENQNKGLTNDILENNNNENNENNKFNFFGDLKIKKRSSSINNSREEKENSNRKILKKSQSEFYNPKNKNKFNQNNQINFLGETLISNLKIRCKELSKENKEKDDLIKDMKKNMKLSILNELMKENSIYEKQMNKMKNKLFEAYDKLSFYEKRENQMKLLFEQLKKKDKKIHILEQENFKKINEYQNQINELQKENEIKNRKIINQENLIKKLNMSNTNPNSKREFSEKDEKEIINNNKINQENNNNEILLNQELKELRESKNNDINLNEKYKELYHLYIEMKKKGINSPENFFSYSLNTLSNNYSNDENIIIYTDGLIKLLNIKTKEERLIILNYANEFFKNLKNINLLIEKQTFIMNKFFNDKKTLKKENEVENIISKLDQDKVKDIFDKYDLKRNGIISFENMRKAISELNLSEIEEELLLLTKDNDMFDSMKYFEILYKINDDNSKDESLVNKTFKLSFKKNDDIESEKEENYYLKDNFMNDINEEKKDKEEEYIFDNEKKEEKKEEIKEENIIKNEIEDKEGSNNLIEEKKENDNLEEEFKFQEEEEIEKNLEIKNYNEENNVVEKLKNLSEKIKKENKSISDYFSILKKNEIKIDENNVILGVNLDDLNEFLNKKEIQLNNKEKEDLKNKFHNEKVKEENIIDLSLLEKYILQIINS